MPKQKRSSKKERAIPRRRTARQKRLVNLRGWIVSLIVAVIVVALGLAGWGIYHFQVQPYNQPVIQYNDTTLNMRYFINMLKLYYRNAPPDTTIADFADYVEQQIQRNETLIQGSAALGVTIDRKSIEQELKDAGLDPTRERVDIMMAQKLLEQQVPPVQPQYEVEAMLLQSETAGEAAKARVAAGEDFAEVAEDVSRITGGAISGGQMGWVTPHLADLTVSSTNLGELIAGTANGTLAGPVYDDSVMKKFAYWVTEVVEKTEATDNETPAKIHVLGILLGSDQQALDVIDQLNDGADINELAKEVSLAPGTEDNGAELGWITEGIQLGDFGQLFDAPLNTAVGPISDNVTQTPGGYWVINIQNTDANRELSSSQQSTLEQDWLSQCTAALQADPDYTVENLLTEETRDFALNEVVLDQGKGSVLIGTDDLPDAEAGVSYSVQLKIYGNQEGNTWSITQGTLPEGLTLNTKTGVISGTPKLAGGSGITVMVQSDVHHDTKELVVHVRLAVEVETTWMPRGEVGTSYSMPLSVFGEGNSYKWTVVIGDLPDGLKMGEATGYIYGTPTTAGTYDFTVEVDDGLKTARQGLSIIIEPAQEPVSDNATAQE
jgi:hypothetical protein